MKKIVFLIPLIMGINATESLAASVPLSEIVNRSGPYTTDVSAILDGLNDAFDGAYHLTGFGGLNVIRSIATFTDTRTYRILDTFTNNTGSAFNGTLQYYIDMGSDDNQSTVNSTAFSYVTDEAQLLGRDPAIAFVFGNNAFTQSNASTQRSSDWNQFYIRYNINLAAGQTLSLLNFAALYQDTTARSQDFSQATSIAAQLVANPDLRNLTSAQIASIANFDESNHVPEPSSIALLGLGAIAFSRTRRMR